MLHPPDKVHLNGRGMDEEPENHKQEEKESDFDGKLAQAAVTSNNHKRAENKQKYHTLGNQKKKQRQAVVFSTVSKGTNANAKTRGPLMPANFIQGSSENTPILAERGCAAGGQDPAEVLKHILETFPVPAELSWSLEDDDRAGVLESSWTDIVHRCESMSKIQRHQQEALWEFIHTELIYINKLTIVTDLVLAALEYVHQQGFLQEVSSAQLFSNLPSILHAHRLFWREVLYPILQGARLTGQPFDPLKLEPGCLQFTERFSAYLDYCWDEEKNVEFTRRQLETNPHFHIYVMWVETHPQCGRMRLGDMQAKPHQRITKYPLLLKALLRTTQDPPTQHALHHMLNSVMQFLDSINDYLQFKVDQMDLFELSQRIEGYELHGMGEEIDKHIQECCHFDLTSPIREVGPKAIRKLLLEEPLKVRGRKDSKLEVNVLLFTDVLLLTKAQKKSEKQKVVHPPLTLERIRCTELKDGYSFALVEVSDLGCPVSVYSVSAPSPERCTLWVSTINQAQDALEILRKKEITTPKEPSDQEDLVELETLISPTPQNNEDTEEQSDGQVGDENTLSQVNAGLPVIHNQLETGEVPEAEKDEQYLPTDPVQINSLGNQIEIRDKMLNDEAQNSKEREVDSSEHSEESLINERRVTWNHKTLSPINSNDISQRDLSETSKSNGPHPLLVSGLLECTEPNRPACDVPSELANRNTPCGGDSSTERMKQQDSNAQTRETESFQDSQHRQSGDKSELLTNSEIISRKSPKLRRKRPISSQPSVQSQASRTMPAEAGFSKSITSRNSFSNFDSGRNVHSMSSNTSTKSQDSHLVLKLGSIKQNRGAFWNVTRESLSDPKMPKETSHQNFLKEPKVKSQRSSSIPEIIFSGANSLALEPSPSLPPEPDSQLYQSPLQDLLERAKERDRGRGIAKKVTKGSVPIVVYASSTPSPSHSEGEQEVEAEELEAVRPQLHSFTAKESNVDNSEKKESNSSSTDTPLGASVDWSGWCFDDEEVLKFLGSDSSPPAWLDKDLSTDELQQSPRQEEGEYSEV